MSRLEFIMSVYKELYTVLYKHSQKKTTHFNCECNQLMMFKSLSVTAVPSGSNQKGNYDVWLW